ncbi:MAG: hypothetical protein MUF00_12585 [Gemmatimonadaceae bacterium]|jgi:photosystem II stability/assembly factor-like uncharacterized protein|nr:hypothetical protein [Gemmatimonadaceae bacterium]
MHHGLRDSARRLLVAAALPLATLPAQPRASAPAAPRRAPSDSLLATLAWRPIGPANMSGRIADVEGVPGDPRTIVVGSASGGVWKTTNGGTTWTPLFDKQPVQSIGDLALEPGNPDVMYVGTGEANVRNSASFGIGVFKSTDGGRNWTNTGLRDTRHISRIVINPRDPRKVYVAAIGHAHGPNAERGVFRTEDGGATWIKALYTDDRHGASDLDIDPQNPNILYAGMWYFDRKQWTHRSGDTLGGVYKSIDGGVTWKKLTAGLPKLMGRIGVKVAPSNPNTVYVVAESQEGYLFRSDDQGETWRKVSDNAHVLGRGFYYADLRVDPQNPERVYTLGMAFSVTVDGGRTIKPVAQGFHGDHQTMWIDPLDPKRLLMGDDGGLMRSVDEGKTWEWFNNIPVGQFYQISADLREPFYHLAGGLQDNGVWVGPSRSRESAGLADDWAMMQFGDGYYAVSHPDNPDLFLSDYQGGGIAATDMRTREQREASPQPKRMDGFPTDSNRLRFNWNAPIVQSPHDRKIVYFAGNILFRSSDWGKSWTAISPDLSRNLKERFGDAGGPVLKENTTAEYYGNIYSVAESPVQKGVIWVGTDDGNLQITQDDGKTWSNVTANLRIAPDGVVSGIEASRTAAGTAYVTVERHMMDDYAPYVFKTTDFGRTFTRIDAGLPAYAYGQAIREDPKNTNLIYLGTETGLYASWTGGGNWVSLGLKNLPSVAVHEVLVHPRENDLIVATHGRALWVLDDASVLQAMTADAPAAAAQLYPMRTATRFTSRDVKFAWGQKWQKAANPPYGAIVTYRLAEKLPADSLLSITVLKDGQVIRTIKRAPREAGINRIAWDLRMDPPLAAPDIHPDSVDPGDWRPRPQGPQVLPGQYVVRLTVRGAAQEQPVTVRVDPTAGITEAELVAQHTEAVRLRDLANALFDGVSGVETVKGQVSERSQTAASLRGAEAREFTAAAKSALTTLEDTRLQLTRPNAAIRPFYSEGPRPLDRVMQAFGAIDGGQSAPIAAQREYANELRADTRFVLELADKTITQTLSTLNPLLQRLSLPPIAAPVKKAGTSVME